VATQQRAAVNYWKLHKYIGSMPMNDEIDAIQRQPLVHSWVNVCSASLQKNAPRAAFLHSDPSDKQNATL